jgi:hypothetical protein
LRCGRSADREDDRRDGPEAAGLRGLSMAADATRVLAVDAVLFDGLDCFYCALGQGTGRA